MVYLPDGISYGTIAGTRHRTYIRCCLFSVQGGQKPAGRRHIQYCRSGKKGGYPYIFVPINEYPLRRNTQRRSYTAHQYGRLGGDGSIPINRNIRAQKSERYRSRNSSYPKSRQPASTNSSRRCLNPVTPPRVRVRGI